MKDGHEKLIVFDIETIPDTEAASCLTDCTSSEVNEQRQALKDYHLKITDGKNDFLRQPFHKVVAISYLICNIDSEYSHGVRKEVYLFKKIGSAGDEHNYDERVLIERFFSQISRYQPRLVSFNGRGFDLPVLKYRAMKYGISCPEMFQKSGNINYSYRYATESNFDLLEVLSDFGSSARIKLNEVCSILGFPGKFGVDGSSVTSLYDDNKLKEIRDYCETDVLNTYLVYLRYCLHSGKITLSTYNHSITAVLNHIENSQLPHLLEFKQAWETACGGNFLLPE